MKKKYSFTLMEIMVVLFLIGIIGSVVGWNIKGSMEKGRVFKSRQNAQQVREILLTEMDGLVTVEELIARPEFYLRHSGIVKDPQNMLKDGWGEPFKIEADDEEILIVRSEKLDMYDAKQKAKAASN